MANCANCGAPLTLDFGRGILVCGHCGSQQQPSLLPEYVDLQGETSLLCATCATPLSAARLDGCSLLCCARCHGMLIEMGRFAEIIEAVRRREGRTSPIVLPRRQNPSDRAITCPSCGQAMLAHLYAGPGNVVIDTCERCQVNWLDAGELRRIARA